MITKKIIYTSIASLALILTSCAEDSLFTTEDMIPQGTTKENSDGIDVYLDGGSKRTRNVNFSLGSSITINAAWIGVFDMNGNKVADQHQSQRYRKLSSGTEYPHFLYINWEELATKKADGSQPSLKANTDYFIVSVANYADVKARKNINSTELEDLETLLSNVKTWQEFNAIGIDTRSAYDDNEDHSTDTPLLAGFLNEKDLYKAEISSSTHISVNQYGNGYVNLLPEKLVSGSNVMDAISVQFNTNTKRFYTKGERDQYTLNHTIYYRRLVANINVNITSKNENIIISQVGYRRFNLPKTVYIIERTLLDPTTNAFPTTQRKAYSPNFSDNDGEAGFWKDDDNAVTSDSSDKEVQEQSKKNWQYQGVTGSTASNSYSFSFQHFANKHWARTNNMTTYEQREETEVDGNGNTYFKNLASSADDINNNATYFIIKMHILDKSNNRCAEAEYLIHEGYTSGIDGKETTNNADRLSDFSCSRNIDYTYNVEVYGIDKIFVNIEGSEHRADMAGRVWNMKYIHDLDGRGKAYYDGEFHNMISKDGGNYFNILSFTPVRDGNGKYKFETDIAFRLYGYDSDKKRTRGYNYNFTNDSFNWLYGLWPNTLDGAHYYMDLNSLLEAYVLPEDDEKYEYQGIDKLLFNTFKIIDADQYREDRQNNFTDFDRELEQKNLPQNDEDRKDNYWMDIVQFIEHMNLQNSRTYENDSPKKYHIHVEERKITYNDMDLVNRTLNDYYRGLYIGDRNGIIDNDGCTMLVNIYAAIQEPPLQ